jgi:hypothetical protein
MRKTQVNIDRASGGVGDDEQRAHKEINLDALIHAACKVAVRRATKTITTTFIV